MACGDVNLLSHAGALPASFANLSAQYLVLNLNNNHLSGVQDPPLKLGNSAHVCSPACFLADVPLHAALSCLSVINSQDMWGMAADVCSARTPHESYTEHSVLGVSLMG